MEGTLSTVAPSDRKEEEKEGRGRGGKEEEEDEGGVNKRSSSCS